jgi:diguanylate cyclase (GGDEF)-like protein
MKRFLSLVAVTCLIAGSSSFVYISLKQEGEQKVQEAFAERTEEVSNEINQEVQRYQGLVSAVGAFFNASDSVAPNEFDEFINGLGTKATYPGVKGMAYAQRLDGSEQPQFLEAAQSIGAELDTPPSSVPGDNVVILYVSPTTEQVPRGISAYNSPGRREGLEKSAASGSVVSSVPIEYQVDGKDTTGYILAYPTKNGTPIDLASHDNYEYNGWVLAFIDPAAVYPSLPAVKDLNLRIVDASTETDVVESTTSEDSDYRSSFTFDIGGRERIATVTATPAFVSSAYDSSSAFRYAFFVANVEVVAVLLGIVFIMHKTRRRREVNLTHQAAHDVLTGLPNRFFLERWLKERVASPGKRQQRVAVLFIDLDGFKAINDTLGHQMGDEFLIAISQRLQKEVRGRDVLARLGGDEFIVVLDEVTDEIQATRIAQRLIEVVRFPVMLDSGPVCVGASIGIAITQLDANSDSTSVIRFADAAMYAAKEDKNERIRVFDHKLKSIVDGRHEVESSIRGASSRSEIVDVLQPQINVADGTTFGYEALCRWNHPNFGILSPDQFLVAAEVTGEIIEIDRWMVTKAFQNALDIYNATGEVRRVWVNLSVRHLLQGEFYRHVRQALKDSDATADMLGVEIEEEVFKVDNGLLFPFLNDLRELGISIALDDFGSEDVSLQALKRYHYDVIKLDRSLITEFAANPSMSIVPAVVELARSQDMLVIASGVETPDVLQSVIDIGCHVVQGYVFSPAQPYNELIDLEKGFTWQMPLGVKKAIHRSHIESTATLESGAREA